MVTSQGKVLLAALPPEAALKVLAEPSRSGLSENDRMPDSRVLELLATVREQGWALADEELAPGGPFHLGRSDGRGRCGARVHECDCPCPADQYRKARQRIPASAPERRPGDQRGLARW
jgi:hypothetical protein